MAAQMWTSIRQLSVTSDEIDHLHAGYRYLQCNDFGWNPEHPPLAKMVAALPLLFMHVNDPIPNACALANNKEIDFRAGHAFVFANSESVLTAARIAASLFAIGVLVATWFFARSLFGGPVAVVASALVAFEPNLIGHGALVTTDVPAALGFLLAIYAGYRYLIKPAFERILVLGLAMGLALALKFSCLTLLIILPLIFLADTLITKGDRWRKLVRRAGAFAVALIIAALVLWASYGFRYSARPHGIPAWTNGRAQYSRGIVPTRVIPALQRTHLLPQAYRIGLQDVSVESELGRPAYLLGRNYLGGRWYYFPVTASLKLTVPFLFLFLLAFAAFRFWRTNAGRLAVLMLPVILFMATTTASGINIGLRHVFPVIPLLAIFGAASIWNVPLARNSVMGLVAVLLVAHAASSLHAFPNYISYGNELWGGPENAYKYVADSNTDWGQAQKLAASYLQQKKPASCFLIESFNNRKSDYGIPCATVSDLERDIPPLPFTGTLIASSNVVDGIIPHAAGVRAATIFRGLKPKDHIGGSAFLVYEGTFDLSPIISMQHLARIGVDVDEPNAVLEEAKLAAGLDPQNADAYFVMCQAYLYLGQRDDARSACNAQLKATKSDIYSGESDRMRIIQMMTINGLLVDPDSMH
ncbi:MAG: glycosyltransferase family 39 protein [Terriglobales bacterium]